MWTNIKGLFESKAFIMALLAAAAAAGLQWGIHVPVAGILAVISPFMVAIGASGWTEAAVAKAKIEQETALKVRAMVFHPPGARGQSVSDALAEAVSRPAQSGSVSTRMMSAITMIAVLVLSLAGGTLMTTTSSGCAEGSAIATDVIDCTKAEADAVAKNISVMSVFAAVVKAITQVATLGLPGVEQIVESLIATYGGPLVACAIDNYPTPAPGAGSGSGSATKLEAGSTEVTKATLLQRYFPGKRIQHGSAK